MAIAVAALTGRRHVEVVAQGQFSLSQSQHRYLLHFEGQAKKRNDQPQEGFDILTLIPAAQTLALIDRFRKHPTVTPLIGLDDEHPDVQAFHARVNRRVEKLFGQSGLVPVLHGFKTVSIHRLRALWGAIAYHFFAPGQKNPQRFLQHYLGHVSDTVPSAANAPVTGHYFHYRLWRNGKELTVKGVKLAGAGMLPEDAIASLGHRGSGEPIEPPTAAVAVPESTAAPAATSILEAAPADSAPESASESTIDPTPNTQPLTPNPQPLLADTRHPTASTKPHRHLVKPIPVDLHRLRAATAQFGIEIRKSKGYGFEMALDQLLIALTSDPPQPEAEPTITQAVSAQAKTLEFLTQEIESLRKQLQQVSQERDQAIDQLQAIDRQQADLAALQAENHRLKSAHTSLMQAYNQLLASGGKQAMASPPLGEVPTDSATAQGSPLEQPPSPRPKAQHRSVSPLPMGAQLPVRCVYFAPSKTGMTSIHSPRLRSRPVCSSATSAFTTRRWRHSLSSISRRLRIIISRSAWAIPEAITVNLGAMSSN